MFIELTSAYGDKTLVNVDTVESMSQDKDENQVTVITFIGDRSLLVIESISNIYAKIKKFD